MEHGIMSAFRQALHSVHGNLPLFLGSASANNKKELTEDVCSYFAPCKQSLWAIAPIKHYVHP